MHIFKCSDLNVTFVKRQQNPNIYKVCFSIISMEKTDNLEDLMGEKSNYDFYKSFSSGQLVDTASEFKYSNLYNKMYNIILPGFRGSEKDIARKVLEEKGIDWKTRQVERYNARKRAKRIYWNNIKNELIAPWKALCENFYNLFTISYSYSLNKINQTKK